MPTKPAAKPPAKAKRRPAGTVPLVPADGKPFVRGDVVTALLASVRPNTWNPNVMTPFQIESTESGMRKDGWLASQALLVWGKAQDGSVRNVIIDGEHRWKIATSIGFTAGPMVFLDGLTEQQAKELTIGLDNKRGKFDPTRLRDVLSTFGEDPGLAFRLGYDDDAFAALMAPAGGIPPGDFSEVSIDATTKYRCPSCKYEWNASTGASAAAKKKKKRGSASAT